MVIIEEKNEKHEWKWYGVGRMCECVWEKNANQKTVYKNVYQKYIGRKE